MALLSLPFKRIKHRRLALVLFVVALLAVVGLWWFLVSRPVATSTIQSSGQPIATDGQTVGNESARKVLNTIETGRAYQEPGFNNVSINLIIPKDHTLKAIWVDYSEDRAELAEPHDLQSPSEAVGEGQLEQHNVTIPIDRLERGVLYYYQAVAEINDDERLYGNIASFRLPTE